MLTKIDELGALFDQHRLVAEDVLSRLFLLAIVRIYAEIIRHHLPDSRLQLARTTSISQFPEGPDPEFPHNNAPVHPRLA